MAVICVLLPVELLLYEDDFPDSRWATAIGTFMSLLYFFLQGEGGKKAASEPSTQSLTKQFLLYALMYTSPAMPLAANT